MTLIQLQTKLGEQIEFFTNESIPVAEREKYVEVGKMTSSLAKQFINGTDIVLRTTKMKADGKLTENSALEKLVGI